MSFSAVHLKFIGDSLEVLENGELIVPRKCRAEFVFPLFRTGGPRSRGWAQWAMALHIRVAALRLYE
jgi:hypothetical protein